MSPSHHHCLALALAAGFACLPAHAAQDYDSCTGFIESLPAVISTPGTWCLRRDVSTSQSWGPAIHVIANNVTLDCNGFKVGGLSAGPGTGAVGVQSQGRANVVVRDCAIRGFHGGVYLQGSGHLVEDSRFDGNRAYGIGVDGDGSVVRRNRVLDTGGSTQDDWVTAIRTSRTVDIIDNVVAGVLPVDIDEDGQALAEGIAVTLADGSTLRGNRVRDVIGKGPYASYGIRVSIGGPFLRHEKKSWDDARADCKLHGGDLATPHSAAELAWLSGPYDDAIWLGGSDTAEEGTWRWIDGSPMDYTAWASGQPTDPDGQHDHLAMSGDGSLQWFADNKATPHLFLCDYKNRSAAVSVRENVVTGSGEATARGISGKCRAKDNVISHISTTMSCVNAGGNQVNP